MVICMTVNSQKEAQVRATMSMFPNLSREEAEVRSNTLMRMFLDKGHAKKCVRCNLIQMKSEFHRKNEKNTQSMCKTCSSKYHREHYLANKARYAKNRSDRRSDAQARLTEYKTGKPCADCGKSFHFSAMDFDHVTGDKVDNVASMPSNGYSWDTILEEIAKCELVCANCHRVRTFMRSSSKG